MILTTDANGGLFWVVGVGWWLVMSPSQPMCSISGIAFGSWPRPCAHAALSRPCDADGMLKHLTEATTKGGGKPSSPCSAGSSLFLRCRMPPTFGNTADERSPTPGSVVTNSRRRRRTCSSRAPSQRHHRPLQQPPSSFLWHRGGGSSQTAAAAWQAGRGPRKLW